MDENREQSGRHSISKTEVARKSGRFSLLEMGFAICLWTEERTTMPGEEGAALDIRAVSLEGEKIEMPDRAKIPYQLESGHGKI